MEKEYWYLIIGLLVAGLVAMSVRLFLTAKRINKQTKLLPPPFQSI